MTLILWFVVFALMSVAYDLLTSFNCELRAGEENRRGNARISSVVASGDTAELVQIAEEVFDEMTLFVHFKAARNWARTVSFRRDEGACAPLIQLAAQTIIIEGLIAERSVEFDALDQGLNSCAVMPLSRRQQEPHEIAENIDQRYDLGGQAAARSANGPILNPRFASAPSWWPGTIGPSTIAYSKSGLPDNTLKSSSKAPFCVHRPKRLKVQFFCPNGLWKVAARHANPRGPQRRLQKHPVACCRPPGSPASAPLAPIARRSKPVVSLPPPNSAALNQKFRATGIHL